MSNPFAARYSKKGCGESSPRPFALIFSRVALLKEMPARDLTAIFTAVIAEDASLLDGVQAAHPLLWAGFGAERTPFAQLDLLLGNHLPAAYGTGHRFRFCVLLSQLHRLPDGPGRAGDHPLRQCFLPLGLASAPARFGSGRCSLPYKAPVQQETSSFSSTSSFLSPSFYHRFVSVSTSHSIFIYY